MKTIRGFQLLLIAWLTGCLSASASGDPLAQWHKVQMTGSVPFLSSIRYGHGKWLGLQRDEVAAASFLVESTDGRDWMIQQAFGPGDSVTDLDFADGLWVLAGTRQETNLLVLTSTNAVNWSSPSLPQVTVSPGGSWMLRRSPAEWFLIPWAMNVFLRSSDGERWALSPMVNPRVASQLPADGLIRLMDIVYGDGRWVAILNVDAETSWSALAVSTNLADWEWWQALPRGQLFGRLQFSHGLWIGVAYNSWVGCSLGTTLITSTDGASWTPRFGNPGPAYELDFDERFVLVGNRVFAGASPRGLCGVPGAVLPPPATFESDPLVSLRLKQPGELTVTRASGIPVVVEASVDLRQWQTLTNLPLGQAVQPLADRAVTGLPARFYRARTP